MKTQQNPPKENNPRPPKKKVVIEIRKLDKLETTQQRDNWK